MERKNSLIAAQAFIMLCAFALPFISLYCQEKPIRAVSASKTAARQRPMSPKRAAVRRRPMARRTPITTAVAEPVENITQEAPVAAEDTEEVEANPTASTKQAQTATPAPNTWANLYRNVASLVLANVYQNVSKSGIGAFTAILTKLFSKRRDSLAQKKEFEEMLASQPKGFLKNLPEKDLSVLESTMKKFEKETSLSHILSTGVYIGILNTVIPTIGGFIGLAIGMALQALMPRENS